MMTSTLAKQPVSAPVSTDLCQHVDRHANQALGRQACALQIRADICCTYVLKAATNSRAASASSKQTARRDSSLAPVLIPQIA